MPAMVERDLMVLRALSGYSEGATVKVLAAGLGMSPALVYQSLRRLLMEPVAVARDAGWPQTWTVIGESSPEHVDVEEPYPGWHDPIGIRRSDVELCSYLLRAYLRTGAVGDPTRDLICRLDAALARARHAAGEG